MSKSSYQILKDVLLVVNRLEDKVDKKISLIETRLDVVESKTDNLLGKIGISVLIVSSCISLIVSSIINWVKNKLS